MTAERTIELMEAMRLLNWASVLTGWDHGWLTKTDVINYAVKWMLTNPSDDRRAVALLAGAEEYDGDEVRRLLTEVVGNSQGNDESAMDKWRLAALVALSEENIEWDEKVTRLEEQRAVFGFPADMRLCTRYGPSDEAIKAGSASESDRSVDPLDAMAKVIAELKHRLSVG